ncbi:MAG: hypothetical protein EAZ06_03560 [Cytophagales bacterium]|nr:MAG: hypothetical protein EAZ06_03560 [Cytophagales bacterium]
MKKNVLLLVLLLLISSFVVAAPQKIKVGVYLMSISKFSFTEGTYMADFYLALKSDQNIPDDLNLDVMNGQITSKVIADNTPKYKVYRYKVVCNENLNYKSFPFDSHSLSLQFEDNVLDEAKIILIADDKLLGVDEKVGIIGWDLSKKTSHNIYTHFYPNFQQKYSRYVFNVTLNKPVVASFIKGVLPCFVIVFGVFMLYFMNPKEPKDRINAMASLLIANVILHINSTAGLPPLSYMTVQDKLMITNYLAVLASIGVTVILIKYMPKNPELLPKINRRAQLIVYPSYIFLQIMNIVWIY